LQKERAEGYSGRGQRDPHHPLNAPSPLHADYLTQSFEKAKVPPQEKSISEPRLLGFPPKVADSWYRSEKYAPPHLGRVRHGKHRKGQGPSKRAPARFLGCF
jgi:hypothetical protein